MIRTGAGLTLVQEYQHHEFCLCSDPNEAPDRTDTCVAISKELRSLVERVERESFAIEREAIMRFAKEAKDLAELRFYLVGREAGADWVRRR